MKVALALAVLAGCAGGKFSPGNANNGGGSGDAIDATASVGGSAGSAGSGGAGGAADGGELESGERPESGETYSSCNELHAAAPALPSGAYGIRPWSSTETFLVYCDMETQGGGWTLVLNESPSFDPMVDGITTQVCHDDNCTNRAYSTVPVGADMMLDMRDGDIAGDSYLARAVVLGVHSASVGKTVRTLFTTDRFYLEKEDNSNVFVTSNAPSGCSSLPDDARTMLCNDCDAASCGTAVVTFGDRGSDSTCPEVQNTVFAIGGSYSYTTAWPNCAGWPQAPNSSGHHHYPNNFRIWVR